VDTVSYADRTGPVVAEIDKDQGDDGDPTLREGQGEGDTIMLSVENVLGGSGSDSMVGDKDANLFRGGAGIDSFAGGRGDDVAYGGGAQDSLRGDEGNDRLLGGGGSMDILAGGDGDDTLIGGGGKADRADGGPGTDGCDAEKKKACEGPPKPSPST
jgi:Ca2+-binding RTX toxin-like protein